MLPAFFGLISFLKRKKLRYQITLPLSVLPFELMNYLPLVMKLGMNIMPLDLIATP
jgi:hypothetical protein